MYRPEGRGGEENEAQISECKCMHGFISERLTGFAFHTVD